jgi:hypothetical protein
VAAKSSYERGYGQNLHSVGVNFGDCPLEKTPALKDNELEEITCQLYFVWNE